MDEQQQIVEEFVNEAQENLDKLDQELVALESDPSNKSTLSNIFRIIHTFKGTCGFLGFKKLESMTHSGESLLDSLRAARLVINPDIASALLQLVDAIRTILSHIASDGSEGEGDYTALVGTLTTLNGGAKKREPQITELTEHVAIKEESTPTPPASVEQAKGDIAVDLDAMFAQAQAEYDAIQASDAPSSAPVTSQSDQTLVAEVKGTADKTLGEEMEVTPPVSAEPSLAKGIEEEKKQVLTDSSLRVDVSLLDQLMNLVGELVLARNQILQFTKTQRDSDFLSTSQRLNLITSELQEGVMRTRMQPIANVWNKFPRVVRDVATQCKKQVKIVMEGKETDLDKTIIEAIKDPLTHIVRNSVDHGLETPEVRLAHGKNPDGILLLRAFHEGGHVIIEISDDGAGLNTERIREKAIERGIVPPEKAARMSESEVNRLIFVAGFSTADKVTNLSGRGVGMDVVRTNIEKIGGTVDVSSIRGKGTTLKIKIPLTLAIVPALVISSGGERYAIPQVSLLELLRIEGDDILRLVEEIDGANFYRLRGNLLPLVYLNRELKLEQIRGGEDSQNGVLNIVVVKADDRSFGLVVDEVHDTEEIVVKPLGKQLKDVGVFAGATIMGDGHVALILDVLGLAQRAGVLGDGVRAERSEQVEEQDAETVDNRRSLLIVQAGEGMRAAIPLDLVNRLEEFQVSDIEQAAGKPVVQYRGSILPLVDLPEYFTHKPSRGTELKQVVVFSDAHRSIGFVVDKILDIVEEVVAMQTEHVRLGISGSAIIQKQVTDVLDLEAILVSENYSSTVVNTKASQPQ